MVASAAKRAALTKKRKAAAKKAVVIRKRRAAGSKAAKSRQQSAAGRTMSEANTKTIRIVREVAMRKGQLDKLAGLYADNYVYHGIPMLGDLRGPTAFRDLVTGFIDAVSEFRETVQDQFADGDRVVTRLSGGGRHTGALMGVAPSGNELRWTAIVISRFHNGKIAEEWAEFDALSFSQQLSASRGH